MKVWLLGLGLALLCSVHAQIECSGNERLIEGTWHVIALASNCDHFLKNKDSMKMVTASLSITGEGKFRVTSNFPTPNGCKKVVMDFQQTENGMYTRTSDMGKETIEIVKSNCKDYAISSVKIERGDKTSTHVVLYSKDREVSQEIAQEFKAVVESKGLTSDQTVFFPPEVACENVE
ncbi:extracellular fatty acid-binding protein-like [Eublepharis macularius]|uniref:Extracellular fatty acid-binding protein-like n=1 Tax=Eublepharis macularius TaxID=481883 RepID=A0AA97K887_EUBMA|nr:extracellular fatty acid-binding protein-like [Eublepharis macularius]